MWAQSGAAGALPTDWPVHVILKPSDDLQAAIDAAPEEGVIIALSPGDYVLTQTLRLRSGVLLRGTGPRSTVLQLQLRGSKPAADKSDDSANLTTGVLLDSVKNAGLTNLTVAFGESLPAPPDPRTSHFAYRDDPDGRSDLHVVAVRLANADDCWLTNCVIRNSGTNPLVIASSRHITVSGVEVTGTYNRGPRSGRVELAGSEYVLLEDVSVRDVGYFLVHAGPAGQACRYNVIANSRIEVDVRFHDAGTSNNLLQNTVIAVPSWHNRPAISQGRADDGELPPGPGNLFYLCTITRNFSSGGRSFSLADNPTRVYRVLEQYSNNTSVADAGPAPDTGALWLAK